MNLQIVDCIEKVFETKRQRGLNSEQRKANILGSYKVTNEELVKDKNILIVDDVVTTGSTINECAKMLLFAGAKSCTAVCAATVNIEKANVKGT